MKTIDQRIAFYLKKVAQKGLIHISKPQPKSHKYRHQRLSQYKSEMHRRIKEVNL